MVRITSIIYEEAKKICEKNPNKYKAWKVDDIENNKGTARVTDSQYLDTRRIVDFKIEKSMQQSITKKDIERFRELLTGKHSIFDKNFNTDEIRIQPGGISIWNSDLAGWYYLNEDLEWLNASENEDILKLV